MSHCRDLRRGPRPSRQIPLGTARLVVLSLSLTLILISLLSIDYRAAAQDDTGEVYVVPITGTIDLGLAPYLERVLDEAADDEAAAVLLEIDTPGGRLDAVLQMQDTLLSAEVPTIAFVNRNAFSAGALITIASERIYMAPGAALGAATPVDGGTGDTASEKVISAVRKTFKATAEARGRDPLVAEAMVDPEVTIDGLIERGKLLTLTTQEAQQWGYADGVAADRAELLAAEGLANASIVETSPSLAEDVVRFITDPVIAGLLMIGGILLIIGDFFVEGLGFAALGGVALLAVFFWGHTLAGLAGWEDVALVALGLGLLAVELFVIPGFGVAGILGIVGIFGGLFLAMMGREIRTPEQTTRAGVTVGVAFVAVVAGFMISLFFLPRSKRLGSLVLGSTVIGEEGTVSRAPAGWLRWFSDGDLVLPADRPVPATNGAARPLVGATGVVVSDLRPSGAVEIDGQRIDVVSAGDYIRAGEPVEVVADEGYRRVVRRVVSR